jgi:tripartite-type tricarboxylate transporter receptor subunit TctC
MSVKGAMMPIRQLFSSVLTVTAAAAFVLLASAAPSMAEPWPTKQPIKVIVSFPAGSSLDVLGRPVFDHVSKQIGQTVVFEYRAGAGGTLGMAAVAKADPDGYTLLINSSVHTITPSTYSKLPYDTQRDLNGIIPLGQFPNVLVVPPDRWKTVQELVAAGKAKPGAITYGSGGIGAATHLNAERFRLSAGFEALHVPFRGAPDVLREILGGRIDFYFSPLTSAVPLIESGQVRGLAVSSLKRNQYLPDVPTTLEAGYPNSDYVFWIGVFAPGGTPRDIVNRLNQAIQNALKEPAIQEAMKKMAAEPMIMQPEEFDRYISAEIEAIAAVVKAAGIQPN